MTAGFDLTEVTDKKLREAYEAFPEFLQERLASVFIAQPDLIPPFREGEIQKVVRALKKEKATGELARELDAYSLIPVRLRADLSLVLEKYHYLWWLFLQHRMMEVARALYGINDDLSVKLRMAMQYNLNVR